jgi:hydrogenase maturation protein HypF
MNERRHVTVEGIVQGVGFRPFVHGLALKNSLAGFVLNDSAGVTIELEGERPALESFLTVLTEQPPPLARVENVNCRSIPPKGEAGFKIVGSHGENQRSVLISPDTPTCEDCLKELFNPNDRRYRYPFINCTNCGPRFTIVKDVPYDRERTRWIGSRCARIARGNFTTRPIAGFMPSPTLARAAARGFELWILTVVKLPMTIHWRRRRSY